MSRAEDILQATILAKSPYITRSVPSACPTKAITATPAVTELNPAA